MHRYDQDVVEADDGYAAAATYASGGAPVTSAPGHVAFPLYGMGQAQTPAGAMELRPIGTVWDRLRWPAIGFALGAAAMGGAWFYFGHWLPMKVRASGRKQ